MSSSRDFPAYKVDPSERILVDTRPRLRVLFFPFLEALLATGVIWAGIGYLDSRVMFQAEDYPTLRLGLYCAWGAALLWLLVRPTVAWSRRRLVVTTHRLLVRFSRTEILDIPLAQVAGIQKVGSSLQFGVRGSSPVSVEQVAKIRKVKRVVERQLRSMQQVYS